MPQLRRAYALVLLFGLLGFSAPAHGETSKSQNGPATQNQLQSGERRVTLTQTVEPSFHIEPIVHRFEARRGAVIPFQFEIKSTGKAMNVSVLPVRLRQEQTGIILHDAEGDSPKEIRFTSPNQFRLAPGESQFIEGEVTVPLAKSNFLSFGVLVRDNGQVSADAPTDTDATQVRAGIKFVTQYVLRIDIETGVKDLSQMDHLVFEQARIFSERGMPVAKAVLANPTEFAFECAVRGTIESSNSSRTQPFRMTLPSRINLEGEERFLVRVMPKSKVVVSAPVDTLLFPGEQALKLEITNGRRAVMDNEFQIRVGENDFPALKTQLAYLSEGLSVNPAQIAVGKIAGVSRSSNLRFTNNSDKPKQVQLELRDLQGNPLDGIRFSSSDFQVKPGRTKTIRASIQSTKINQALYGEVQLLVSNDGVQSKQSLPLAMLLGKPPATSVEIGEIQSLEKNGQTSFRLMVTNQGQGYAPVHADLVVAKENGRAVSLSDGYGRWLKPGESRELMFEPPYSLEAGKYQVSLNVQTTPEEEPYTQTLIIELTPEVAAETAATELATAVQAG